MSRMPTVPPCHEGDDTDIPHPTGVIMSTPTRATERGGALTRLARACAFHPLRTLAVWATAFVAIVLSASAFGGQLVNEFSIPGSDTQSAVDLLQEKFPEAGGGSARVVFAAPEGEKLTDPDNKAAVMESVENASKAPEVSAVQDPYSMGAISKDGRIGFADVYYPVKAEEVEKSSADALVASTKPASPVRYQPSAVFTSAVACGFL